MSTRFGEDFKSAKEKLELPPEVAEGDIFGIKDPSKFPVPKEIKRIIRAKEAQKRGEVAIVKAKSPEGKEIIFDFEKEREHWQDFYEKHGIKADIPEINLTREQVKEVEKLIEEFGFNKIIIIPENLPNYSGLHQKTTKKYNATYQGDNFKKDGLFQGVEDLKQGARIIFTKDTQNTIEDDFFKQTVNLPPEDPKAENDLKRFIENIKQEKGIELEGLALSEYLIYQKEYHERTNNHLDANGWTWLIGSKMKRSARFPGACWGPTAGGLRVIAGSPSDRDSVGGCRLSRSLKLFPFGR